MINAKDATALADKRNQRQYAELFTELDKAITAAAKAGRYMLDYAVVDSVPEAILIKLHDILVDCGYRVKDLHHVGQLMHFYIEWNNA